MVVSILYYAMGILILINREFVEITIFPISNTIHEYQPIWFIAVFAIAYSLFKNYRMVKKSDSHFKRIMFGRIGFELQIMLLGTLASLIFYMGMAFSNSLEYHIGATIMALMMIYANIKRDKIVDGILKHSIRV